MSDMRGLGWQSAQYQAPNPASRAVKQRSLRAQETHVRCSEVRLQEAKDIPQGTAKRYQSRDTWPAALARYPDPKQGIVDRNKITAGRVPR